MTVCISCGWEYKDPNPTGMGIHECPARCPECGGRIRTQSNKFCTYLSISRDPYCTYHGDVDKVAIMMKAKAATSKETT